MKSVIITGLLFFLSFYYCTAIESEEIISILKTVDSILLDSNARFEISMVITKGDNENKYDITLWAKNRNFVCRTNKPIAQKGQVYLLNNDDSWIYYPEIKKTIKTSKNQKLLGGDFSFTDLASVNLQEDYDSVIITMTEEELSALPLLDEENKPLIVKDNIMEATVIAGKKVQYPKVRLFLNEEKQPIRMEFYTISGRLLGIMQYKNYKQLDGKLRPETVIMRSSLNKERYTILTYVAADYTTEIPEIYFRETYMKRISVGR